MIPQPPSSTPFPYTTLFRSRVGELDNFAHVRNVRHASTDGAAGSLNRRHAVGGTVRGRMADIRSEEHTSELQSQSNLVCRLLLEKKKHVLHHEVRLTLVPRS